MRLAAGNQLGGWWSGPGRGKDGLDTGHCPFHPTPTPTTLPSMGSEEGRSCGPRGSTNPLWTLGFPPLLSFKLPLGRLISRNFGLLEEKLPNGSETR